MFFSRIATFYQIDLDNVAGVKPSVTGCINWIVDLDNLDNDQLDENFFNIKSKFNLLNKKDRNNLEKKYLDDIIYDNWRSQSDF